MKVRLKIFVGWMLLVIAVFVAIAAAVYIIGKHTYMLTECQPSDEIGRLICPETNRLLDVASLAGPLTMFFSIIIGWFLFWKDDDETR